MDPLEQADGKEIVDGQIALEKIMAFFSALVAVFTAKGKTLAYFQMPDGSEFVWSKKPLMKRALDKKAENILKD